MASTPNLNPPVSSAAVHAAIFQAKAPRRGENPDPERGRQRAKCVPARTETQFRGALNRGLTIEVTREPAEQIGVMGEDGGSVEEITTARSELHDPEWRRGLPRKNASWISSTEGPAAFHCPARTVTDIVLSCFLMMLM